MSEPALPRGGPGAGFTLIEMTITLFVIALVATLALPFVRPHDSRAGLRAKAHETAALLRLDRTAARRTGRMVTDRIVFPGPVLRSGASRAMVDLSQGLAVRARGAAQGYRFHPDGRSSGGEITLATGADAMTVSIDGVTSAVTIRAAAIEGR